MSGSTIPAALTALVTTFRTVTPTTCDVFRGRARDPQKPRFLCVGFDESGQAPVTGARDLADYGGSQDQEAYDVSNLLTCWAGNETPDQLEADTLNLFDVFAAAVDADRSLDQAVAQARVTQFDYQPAVKRDEGVLVQVRFTVNIVAWK